MGRKKYSKELKSTEIVFFCNLHHSEHAVMKKIPPKLFEEHFLLERPTKFKDSLV